MLENKKSAGMRLFRHFSPTEMPEECILRRAAATDAESSGHPADLNGHPQNLIPCA